MKLRRFSARNLLSDSKIYRPSADVYPPMWYDAMSIRIQHRLKLTDLAHTLGTDFKVLKELNPQLLGDHLPEGNHTIKVPPGFGSKVATVLRELDNRRPIHQEKISRNRYLVREADALGYIAERTGVSISTLRRLNGIQGATIWAGQKLRLTPQCQRAPSSSGFWPSWLSVPLVESPISSWRMMVAGRCEAVTRPSRTHNGPSSANNHYKPQSENQTVEP